jgi:BON domain/CBS domain
MHRAEIGTERRYRWWPRLVRGDVSIPFGYIKAHARRAADIMTQNVFTATPETPLDEIAVLLERNSIKRVPIVRDGRLVGIVSRANLVQALATIPRGPEISLSDSKIREELLSHLNGQPWADTHLLNVTVTDGVVSLWGVANSETERNAIRVAAEGTPGVRGVNNHLALMRIVHHWNGADASVHKRFGDLFNSGMGPHRYGRSYHYIPGFHGFLLALPLLFRSRIRH